MLVIVNVLFIMLYKNVVMTEEVMSLCIISGHDPTFNKNQASNHQQLHVWH